MTERAFGTLAEHLDAGESFADALRKLQPKDERELLRRCAAVHAFDDALVEVLRTALEDVPVPKTRLADLVEAGRVEPVPGRDGWYRLRAGDRDAHFARWWSDPAAATTVPSDLHTISERVLEHLDGDEVEALYHRLLVEPEDAVGDFTRLFDAADERLDLAHCQDLLDVVVERLPLLGPEVAVVCNDRRARLQARAMWMDAWYRSARYLRPASVRAADEALLEGRNGRVLALWSPGGMGKTSHVRWLIARQCIPDGDVCALVDFDDLDPLLATREPWLLLLEVAAQLDQQLPGAPFHELLTQYRGQHERLRRRSAATSPVLPADVVERFVDTLADEPGDRRIVIVLDTLEEALLLGAGREQSDLTGLLELLRRLLRDVSALRVVLACRYDLVERAAPSFRELFPDAAVVQLPPFSPSEAEQYLTRYRGIARPDLVERMVRLAEGVPLKLELLADVVDTRPGIDPEELEADAQPGLRYVMERILDRLDPGLRWLVCHGVAARTVERSFVRDVVVPATPEGPDMDLGVLWPALKRYAGRASWIELDPLEPDVLRLHPAVLEPLRELLRFSPVHDGLHRRASKWFQERATSEPRQAARWMREAIFHRFQYQGPAAEKYWQRCIASARAGQRPDHRRELAAELLGADYVDGTTPRPWRDGQPIIDERTLVRARWELAVAASQLAHGDTPERSPGEWLEAERALADLETVHRDELRSALSEGEVELLRAGVMLGRGDLDNATEHLERALAGTVAREDQLWLWLAFAGAASEQGRPEAADYFQQALTVAARSRRRAGSDAAAVQLRLARHHMERDRLDKGIAACEHGATAAKGRLVTELAIVRGQLALRCGRPSEAIDHLRGLAPDQDEVEARRAIVEIRALLAAARPQAAVELGVETGERFGRQLQLGGAREQAVAAEGRELRGKVRAELYDLERAIEDFEEAADRWARLGSAEGVCRCRTRSAAVLLRDMGDIHEAEVRLDEARLAHPREGDDAWTRLTLMGAELLGRRGETERAERLVARVVEALERRRRPPRAFIAAAIIGVTVSSHDRQDRYVQILCDQLARITPAAARLATLARLSNAPVLAGSRDMRATLRNLIPSPLATPELYEGLAARDRGMLLIRDADVDRITGRSDLMPRAIGEAERAFRHDRERAGRLAALAAAVRAHATPLVTRLAARTARELERSHGQGPAPIRDAAMLLQAVEAIDRTAAREQLLAVAGEALDREAAVAGVWLGRLWELRAEVAQRHDDATEAHVCRLRAAEVYESLGDDLNGQRMLDLIEGEDRAVAPVADRGYRVTVRLGSDAITVETIDRAQQRHPSQTDSGPLADALLGSTEAADGRPTAREVVKCVLADPAAVADELGALLSDAVALRRREPGGRDAPVDLGLRLKDAALRALPWELAAPALARDGLRLFRRAPRTRGDPVDIRALQGALVRVTGAALPLDGLLGPDTRDALRRFQRRSGLDQTGIPDAITYQLLHGAVTGEDRPVVTIVRPSRRSEDLAFRGSRQSGVPVERLYRRAGFAPVILDAPGPAELRRALQRRPAAILHVSAGLVEHHGTAAIDLLPAADRTRVTPAGRLTGTTLDALLPLDVPAPLLVMDVTAPVSRRETVTQLLLRNAFCSELVAVGNVRALIATGLGHYRDQERLYRSLIGALADGLTVHEITQAVRAVEHDTDVLEELLTFSATALFARTPDVRLPAPARP